MIAKGNLHANGAKLAAYLMTGKDGEIAELAETRGLEFLGGDPVQAFATAQQIAEAATDCTKPFFHTQTRNAAGEQLSREQWLHVADREEKRLGFSGQPRVVSFHHLPDGSTHMHVAWFRIDLETMRAIDPGLFKNHLKDLCRTLEKELGLTRVRNERAPDDRTRAPDRREFEESRRLKTDLKAIRNTILDCFQQSDSGKAFNAALGAHGLELANGDRRDCFVVVDQAGGQHALNKKLTGMTLADIRERLADIDRTQLPGVEQAQARQQTRERAREARPGLAVELEKHGAEPSADKRPEPIDLRPVFTSAAARTTEPVAPTFDRDAADAEWRDKVAAAGIAKDEAARQTQKPEREKEARKPLEAATATRSNIAREPETTEMPGAGLRSPDRVAGKLSGAIARIVADVLGGVLNFFAGGPPKLTRQQAHDQAQARGNEETIHARDVAAAARENEAAHDDRTFEADRQRQQRDAELYNRFGHVLIVDPDQPREIQRGGREREPDRDE